MKKVITNLGVFLLICTTLASCGKKASDFEYIVKEYKKTLCVVMGKNNNSISDKTKALQRQQDLNKEYEEAVKSLSQEEQSKLMMSWANALAEVSDGKCD